MKNLLAFVGGLLVTFLAVGWYFGWYQIAAPAAQSGHRRLEIDVNTQKMQTDVEAAAKAGKEKLNNVVNRDPNAPPSTPAPAPAPSNPFAPKPTPPGQWTPPAQPQVPQNPNGWRPVGP